MRIIEARDGFIKFEAEEKIALSSFVQVDDNNNTYVGQVVQVNNTGIGVTALVKLLFLYDGAFLPSSSFKITKEAQISHFSFDILSKSLYSNNPIVVGNFANEEILIPIDKDCFNNKMLLSVDNSENKNILLKNLKNQFVSKSKVVVIDMSGDINASKCVAGIDFKLPLNTSSLNFMYEDCLNDATSDSKSLIKEIFTDLSEYSKTVDFLPFTTLKTIVDDMVEKSHIFKLLVLKNKLARFDKLGYFATTNSESENLKKLLTENFSVLDLSKLDTVFQNRYLAVVYAVLESLKTPVQVFINTSNMIDKRSLKLALTNESISTTLIVNSKFKYLRDLKSLYKNFAIEPSFANNDVFRNVCEFLPAVPKNCFVIVGDGTNALPLISKFEVLDVTTADLSVNEQLKEALNTEDVQLVEEDLDKTDELQVALAAEEVDEDIIAINRKSDDLIEKLTEEVEVEKSVVDNIFSETEESEDSEEKEEVDLTDEMLATETLEETREPESIEIESETVILNEEQQVETLEAEQAAVIETLEYSTITESDENIELSEELSVLDDVILDDDKGNIEPNEEIALEVSSEPDFHTEVEETQTIEIPAEISDLADEAEAEAEMLDKILDENVENIDVELDEDKLSEENVSPDIVDSLEARMSVDVDTIGLKEYSEFDTNDTESLEVLPIGEEEIEELDEIVELSEDELTEADIIVDIEDSDGEILDPDVLDREIVEDVDKVFTTMKEDSISDSDLDFIDELNGEPVVAEEEVLLDGTVEELPELSEELSDVDEDILLSPIEDFDGSNNLDIEEKEVLETRNSSTPIVPVYNADIPTEDVVKSDPVEQGDTVMHATYGVGIVEKMIKYGNKTLCSINFDNVGRRVVDPNITEIKKA